MNTWKQVDAMLTEWQKQGLKPTDIIVKLANSCLGWSYVLVRGGQNAHLPTEEVITNPKGNQIQP